MSTHHKFDQFFKRDELIRYQSWKSKRKHLVKILGKRFLAVSEVELSAWLKEWETSMFAMIQGHDHSSVMTGLMLFSILHYFNRSFQMVQKAFPILDHLLSGQDHDIILVATKVMKWFAAENTNNIVFLKKALETADTIWQQKSEKLYFNAIAIMRTVGKFSPEDVFEVTDKILPELWKGAFSPDPRTRSLSVNVLCDHVSVSPKLSNEFVQEAVLNGWKAVLNTNMDETMGALIMFHKLMSRSGHNIIQEPALIHLLNTHFSYFTIPVTIEAVKVMLMCIKVYPGTLPVDLLTAGLCEVMAKCQQNGAKSIELLEYLSKLIEAVPNEYLPVDDLIVMISNNIDKYKEDGFSVLDKILRRFPDARLPVSTFTSVEPSPSWLKALRRQPHLHETFAPKLVELIQHGMKGQPDAQCILLHVIRKFAGILWEKRDLPFGVAKTFITSSNEKVRLELAKTLRCFENSDADNMLLKMAVFDQSKRVRLCAVKQLSKARMNTDSDLIPMILADRSYKVKRAAVSLVWYYALKNPLYYKPLVTNFVNSIMMTDIAPSYISRMAKMCSILPEIARYFVYDASFLVPCLAWVCVTLLLKNEEFPKFPKNLDSKYVNLADAIHTDFAFCKAEIPFTKHEPNLLRIYQIESEKYNELEVVSLFNTLGVLAHSIQPFLFQIIPVFSSALRRAPSDAIIIAALKALSDIMEACDSSVNVREYFPDLLPSLFNLLASGCSDEVAIYIFKTTGIMGTTRYLDYKDIGGDGGKTCPIAERVMKNLFKLAQTDPSTRVYEVIAVIAASETDTTAPLLEEFVNLLVNKTGEDDMNATFAIFELLVWKCQFFMHPFLGILEPIITSNLLSVPCLRLVCQLSYCLKTGFTPIAIRIYPMFIKHMKSATGALAKVFYKFVALAVVYQQQSFDYFIRTAEQLIMTGWEPPTQFILCLLRILRYGNIKLFHARILMLCMHLLPYQSLRALLVQLLYFLVIYGELDIDAIGERFMHEFGKEMNLLRHVMDTQPYMRGKIAFVKEVKLMSSTAHLQEIINRVLKQNEQEGSVFYHLPEPPHNAHSSHKWLYDLSHVVFKYSPSPIIRACSQVAFQSMKLRTQLFPAAFLSCWEAASQEEKQKFSGIVESILSNFTVVDPLLMALAEVVDRAGCPLLISNEIIAKRSASPTLGIHLLLNHLGDNPASKSAIERLLMLNSTMGRYHSARGLLQQAIVHMDTRSAGKWSEELGEWPKALELYEKEDEKDNVAIVRCNGHMQRWETIREMTSIFDVLTNEQKTQCALWYAYAFYHARDYERVEYYLKFCKDNNVDNAIFAAMYNVASGRLDDAGSWIKSGWKLIAADKTVFNGSDAGTATGRLLAAHNLVELNEALEMKRQRSSRVPGAWKHRLNYFCHGSDAWIMLIEIRSLLLSPEEHVDSCLMMMSALRKERQWKLIDSYFNRFFKRIESPKVVLADIKIKWSRGMLVEALDEVRAFNRYLDGEPNEKFGDLASKVDLKMRGRFLRIQGMIELQFNNNEHLEEARESFKQSIEKSEDDYRAWSGLAYACTRMITAKGQFVYDAIRAFLKATALNPQGSLEYLCQMFSILFQHGDEADLGEFQEEIKSLQVNTIVQIVPQLVGHISHNSEQTRNIVMSVLEWFGFTHFETVFYALNFVSLSAESEKARMAEQLIQKLRLIHPVMHNDLQLFVKGMQMSAVSSVERWQIALTSANNLLMQGRQQDAIDLLSKQISELRSEMPEFDLQLIHRVDKHVRDISTIIGTRNFDRLKEFVIRYQKDAEIEIRKVDQVPLSRVCPSLADKRHFAISVPGSEEYSTAPPKIQLIEPTFCVLRTQQRPRSVYMLDESGKKWRFLLKGREDLRVDQRIMQFFRLINNLLASDRLTSLLDVSIVRYAVVPFAPDSGLIGWVENADTMHCLINDVRGVRAHEPPAELGIMQEIVGNLSSQLNSQQRKELYEYIFSKTKANELRDALWQHAPTSDVWLMRVDNFTKSTALMSIAGYVIGLGDRHASNIMIQHDTGKVVHIDFADCFEVAYQRRLFAERVPFRLTRMIVNALDCGSVEGVFRRTANDVMNVLRQHKNSLMVQLEIFVHEPVFSVFQRKLPQNDHKAGLMTRVSMKLSGYDPVCDSPNGLDVEEQVGILIDIAKDPDNYIRHFQGWSPFW